MTTIITKHGTGVPTSLQVGELAIDKSEPALYTNTGSTIEKIQTSSTGGGGGGGSVLVPPAHPMKPSEIVFTSSNAAAQSSVFLKISSMQHNEGIWINFSSAVNFTATDTLKIHSTTGRPFMLMEHLSGTLGGNSSVEFDNTVTNMSGSNNKLGFNMYDVNGTGLDYTDNEFHVPTTGNIYSQGAMIRINRTTTGFAASGIVSTEYSNYVGKISFYTVSAIEMKFTGTAGGTTCNIPSGSGFRLKGVLF